MKRYLPLLILLLTFFSCEKEINNIKLRGPIFGTTYNIQYYAPNETNYIHEIDSLFDVINGSLSTYLRNSDISKLNRNELDSVDEHFVRVFERSKEIYEASNGVFDPTIGNIVNAWNFGAENNKFLTDSTTIDSLMQFVGFNKVKRQGNIIKKPDETYLEFNAIAKGYGIDVISDFLESKNTQNYIVDIGGDLRVSGLNLEKNTGWTIGIDDPNFDGSQSYSKIIVLKDEAIATSGTYRKFNIDKNSNRYAHIIDTKTGYPTKTHVLSVSVIAPDCMTADAYATTFQAMGVEKVTEFLKSHPELKVFFIYENKNQDLETKSLNGFP